jgi:hypothetical protein
MKPAYKITFCSQMTVFKEIAIAALFGSNCSKLCLFSHLWFLKSFAL